MHKNSYTNNRDSLFLQDKNLCKCWLTTRVLFKFAKTMFKFEMSTENVLKTSKVLPVAKIISGFNIETYLRYRKTKLMSIPTIRSLIIMNIGFLKIFHL